jgi:hypothetical protein
MLLVLVCLLGLLSGCGQSSPPLPGKTDQPIPVEEWSKMSPEDQRDPSVLQNLDPAARKAAAAKGLRVP